MTVGLTLAVFIAVLASAQPTHSPATSGAALLVLPRPGVPISMEQIQERSRKLEDGTVSAEIIKSKVFRDLAGRVRLGVIGSVIEESRAGFYRFCGKDIDAPLLWP
jgi:hypothetical protein